jgi:hypothetical protein
VTNGHWDESALMQRPIAEIARLRSRALLVGAAGLGLVIVGVLLPHEVHAGQPSLFWQAYLIAFIFWIGITLGSLGVLMIQHLSGGAWGLVSRRVLEAAARTLPLMALLFVPIYWRLPELYVWARPEAAQDAIIQQKVEYLNVPFFTVRAILYFAVWGALVYVLTRWSKQQDEEPAALPGPRDRRFRVVSGPGLVLFVITVTFMSVDWVMSLDPHWYSTIFGILTIGGQGLATMAFTILVLAALARFRPMAGVADAERFHDLGKLMFAFVMLWAYFSVSQLLIVWSANLPEEVPFYLQRLNGPWAIVSVALLLGQFALPFLLLLSRRLKRSPDAVKWVALFILLMRAVDIAWTVGPPLRLEHEPGAPSGSGLHLLDLAMVLAMGAPWLYYFFTNLAGRALVPARDPYFKEAVAHGGH